MYAEAEVVTVHSVAEAYLYAMVLRCPTCGKGPMKPRRDLTRKEASPGGWMMVAYCAACGDDVALHFAIDPPPTREQARSDCINPTPQRSQAIDLLGWLSLFQTIIAESEKSADKRTGRQLAHEAAQCLDEAMKFYDGGNELPGEGAFFGQDSPRRFRDHPEYFNRSKWRQRRLMLPEFTSQTHSPHEKRRRWWQFWRRG